MTVENKQLRKWDKIWKNPFMIGWFSLILIVISVDVFMITKAITTFSGLTIEDYYEKGKDMGKVIAQRKKMEEMGWQVEVDLSNLVENRKQNYKVIIADKKGIPLEVDSAILYYYRPSDKSYDGQSKLKYTGELGIYSGEITLPLRGKYDFVLELIRGKELFQIGRSIMVKPESNKSSDLKL